MCCGALSVALVCNVGAEEHNLAALLNNIMGNWVQGRGGKLVSGMREFVRLPQQRWLM